MLGLVLSDKRKERSAQIRYFKRTRQTSIVHDCLRFSRGFRYRFATSEITIPASGIADTAPLTSAAANSDFGSVGGFIGFSALTDELRGRGPQGRDLGVSLSGPLQRLL